MWMASTFVPAVPGVPVHWKSETLRFPGVMKYCVSAGSKDH